MPSPDLTFLDLGWDESAPDNCSGVMPVATVRPTYDVAAFARESEERMAIASFVPTTPAPGAPEEKVSIPKSDAPSEELRALVEEDPRD